MDTGLSTKPKGRFQLQYRGVECSNCSHPLDISDKYCPNCSQINSNKKLSIKDFFDEFFASLISYDSKLLKTLAALLLRPGQITIDYIEGKRVRYTNPFRFLLSLSIIYFLLFSLNGNFSEIDQFVASKSGNFLDIDSLSLIEATNPEAEKEIIEQINVQQIDSLGLRENLSQLLRDRDSAILANPKTHFNKLNNNSFIDRFMKKVEFFSTIIKNEKLYIFKTIGEKYAIQNTLENKVSFNGAKGFLKLTEQPGSFFNTIIARLPFVIFFFLPVFTLFIWLLYTRKKYNYTEHLIFSFHNQSLLFILLIISVLIDTFFNINLSALLLLIFGVYLFIAMRKFYKQGWFKTYVKYGILNSIFFILAIGSIFILIGTSIFTF